MVSARDGEIRAEVDIDGQLGDIADVVGEDGAELVTRVRRAFATGSNNNSNVLFGSLQKNAAVLLNLNPPVSIRIATYNATAISGVISASRVIARS